MPRASNIHRLFSGKRFSTYSGSARNHPTWWLRRIKEPDFYYAGWILCLLSACILAGR